MKFACEVWPAFMGCDAFSAVHFREFVPDPPPAFVTEVQDDGSHVVRLRNKGHACVHMSTTPDWAAAADPTHVTVAAYFFDVSDSAKMKIGDEVPVPDDSPIVSLDEWKGDAPCRLRAPPDWPKFRLSVQGGTGDPILLQTTGKIMTMLWPDGVSFAPIRLHRYFLDLDTDSPDSKRQVIEPRFRPGTDPARHQT